MSKFGPSDLVAFLVDEYNLVASITGNSSYDKMSLTEQTNPFGVASVQHTPIGLEENMLEMGDGIFDATTDALHNVAGVTPGVSRVISLVFEGGTIGSHFAGFEAGLDYQYMVKDRRDGLTMADVKYRISGDADEGVVVQDLATFSSSWDTKTGGAGATDAPVDYTVDTANRGFDITAATKANPCQVTTSKAHGLVTGQVILISGNSLSGPAINGEQTITVVDTTNFTVDGVDTTLSTGSGADGTLVLASTENGGVGYLHCTALTVTSLDHDIMHSPDDSTYATLVSFAQLTAAGFERVEVAAGTTVDRYLSSQGTVVGAGNVTVFAGFSRK